jgi:hypothetical protein
MLALDDDAKPFGLKRVVHQGLDATPTVETRRRSARRDCRPRLDFLLRPPRVGYEVREPVPGLKNHPMNLEHVAAALCRIGI